jgi:hypothetical protein
VATGLTVKNGIDVVSDAPQYSEMSDEGKRQFQVNALDVGIGVVGVRTALRAGGGIRSAAAAERSSIDMTPPELPPYVEGQGTQGVLRLNEGGPDIPLQSVRPPPLKNYAASGHVEIMGAGEISARNSTGGVIWHNNPKGTCGWCGSQLPTFLPENATVTVVPPNGAAPRLGWFHQTITRTGNASEPKPWPR